MVVFLTADLICHFFYLTADCVLVSGALLQDGFEWREGFQRAPRVARLSVNVRNLELDRRENVSDVLLRSDTNQEGQKRDATAQGEGHWSRLAGGGETPQLHLLVRRVRRAGGLARLRSHAALGAVRRAVAVEVEAVRKGGFVEEVGGQVVLKIWKQETQKKKPRI